MKTAVIFFYTDERYDELWKCARDSFKKFHPDIDIYTINEANKEWWGRKLKSYDAGDEIFIMQYIYAYEIMTQYKYDKIISLGSDTITCARLDEFLDDNKTDILCTLNYPKPEETEYWKNPIEQFNGFQDTPNINADVVCFNNAWALKKIIDLSIEHYTYFSIQGGLNELYSNRHDQQLNPELYSMKIVDYPYQTSNVVYNARSKGVMFTNQISGNPNSPVKEFKVIDNKLYTGDGKQIKVWHYIEGLGGRPLEKFNELIKDFKYEWFNDETKEFFRNQCKCEYFFK